MMLTCKEYDDLHVGQDLNKEQAKRLYAAAQRTGKQIGTVLQPIESGLKAQQVVGVLAVRGLTLEILPKIDGDDVRTVLIQMLNVAYDLNVAPGELAALETQRQNLLELLIGLFANRLLEAARRGLPQRYIEHEEDLPRLKGRLNVVRQFTHLVARPDTLACRFDERSANTPLNRVLKAAVTRLLRCTRSVADTRRLAEAAARFEFVGDSAEPLKETVRLDRTNTAFHDLYRLAELFLKGDWQTTARGESPGFSLLFEMNKLFENFVGKCLQCALAPPRELTQRREHAVQGSNGRKLFQLRPDFVVETPKLPPLILDTKWKRLCPNDKEGRLNVTKDDVYQMLTYAQAYDAEHIILLYPWHKALSKDFKRSWNVTGTDRKLHVATVDVRHSKAVPDALRKIVQEIEAGALRTAA